MKKLVVIDELTSEGRFNAKIVKLFYWLARYVCPIVIFFMFVNGLRPKKDAPQPAPSEAVECAEPVPSSNTSSCVMGDAEMPADDAGCNMEDGIIPAGEE